MAMMLQRKYDGPEERKVAEIASEAQYLELVSSKAAVLDLYGPKCPPCKAFEPVFHSAAKNNSSIKFGMLDGNSQKGLLDRANRSLIDAGLAQYGVRFYPTQIVFSGGKAVAVHEGKFGTEGEFVRWVEESLKKNGN